MIIALLAMSAATIDLRLAHVRAKTSLTGTSHTRPGSMLRSTIPLKTWAEWDDTVPGFFEIDLVGHDIDLVGHDGGHNNGSFYHSGVLPVEWRTGHRLVGVGGKGWHDGTMIGRRMNHTASDLIPSERLWVSGLGSALGCVWCLVRVTRLRAEQETSSAAQGGPAGSPGPVRRVAVASFPFESSTDGLAVTPGSRAQVMPGDQEAAQIQASEVEDLLSRLPDHWWLQQLGMIAGVTTALAVGAIAIERTVYRIGEGLANMG